MRLWIWLSLLLLSTLLVSEAHADLDPFEFQIYPYQPVAKESSILSFWVVLCRPDFGTPATVPHRTAHSPANT